VKNEKIKKKHKIRKHLIIAWLMCVVILAVDMLTTIKGIKLGAEETNIIPAFFFSFGDIGYLYAFVFEIIVIFIFLVVIVKFCSWLYQKLRKKEMKNNFKIFLYYFMAVIFVLLELLVIQHNIKVIAGLGG